MSLLAVHISDGILSPVWLGGGMLLGAVLVFLAAYRLPEDMIPRVGLLTAAFFVSSLIHVKIPGTSVHLLLNGVVGLMLGRRAALAIFLGLVAQFVLIQHGGITSIGVNVCVLSLPAMLAGAVFPWLSRRESLETGFGRWMLASLAAFGFLFLACASVEMIWSRDWEHLRVFDWEWLAGGAVIAAIIGASERKLEPLPGFPLGLLVGVGVALLTVAGNFAALLFGAGEDFRTLAAAVLIAHIPVIGVEGLIVGFTVSFLLRVQPEMIRAHSPESRGT